MPVTWNPETNEAHLRNEWLSYVFCVLDNGALGQRSSAITPPSRGAP
jgi:hypothetical protein